MVWSLEGLFESDPEEKSLPSLGPIFDARFRQIYRSQVHKKIISFNYDLANCMQARPASCLQCPWPNCTTCTFWLQMSHWQKIFFFKLLLFLEPPTPYVRTFSLHNVRGNCHFLDHPPTPIALYTASVSMWNIYRKNFWWKYSKKVATYILSIYLTSDSPKRIVTTVYFRPIRKKSRIE